MSDPFQGRPRVVQYDEWQKFTYTLDESHPDADFLKLGDEELERVKRLKQVTESCHWRTLELAATTVFLEREAKLDRDQAIERALGHKPACRPFEAQARKLLLELEAELQGSSP